ncbi:hypothetical protein O3P69_019875 [Scylla paramamosain]|uniref:Uncharacterized protein n=1 Tax=Scylla paramamosain TaxID=85552 RepID=A0AAW0SCH4_SCYPA
MTAETDFTRLLQIEEEHVKELCADILALRPDVVITEKGVSDLAQHYLVKAGVTCLRRVKKSDNNRLARACGATICNHTEELKESDVGTQGLYLLSTPHSSLTCLDKFDGSVVGVPTLDDTSG